MHWCKNNDLIEENIFQKHKIFRNTYITCEILKNRLYNIFVVEIIISRCHILAKDRYKLKTCFAGPGAAYVHERVSDKSGGITLPFLQGIASFHIINKTCTEEGEKYLFTLVEKYMTFIESGMKNLSL